MDDVTLIKYLAGNDPRGIPDDQDYRRSPENGNPASRPNVDETDQRQPAFDYDTRPERGERNEDTNNQTRWPSDSGA